MRNFGGFLNNVEPRAFFSNVNNGELSQKNTEKILWAEHVITHFEYRVPSSIATSSSSRARVVEIVTDRVE